MALADSLGRPLRTLRLSVTDRCNLRCEYCMPEAEYAWLPREDFLTPDELDRLADAFLSLGVSRIRLTGGEPLLRPELPEIVERLARKPGLVDLALTTNGVRLAPMATQLRAAGLKRITISLDTLRDARFEAISRRPELPRVLDGIRAAAAAFEEVKLDAVVLRGTNDDELEELLAFAATVRAELRFIEYMDVPGATRWAHPRLVSRQELLSRLSTVFGAIEPIHSDPHAPAQRFRLPTGQTFGIIASTTEPFCATCDRSRVSADGQWLLCLYALTGMDLRSPLRAGATGAALAALIASRWAERRDQGAVERAAMATDRALVPLEVLRNDPHLEMHTRGG